MFPFFVLLVSLLAAQSLAKKVYYHLEDAEHHFEEFITTFNKQYSNEDEKKFRFNIFKGNLKKINKNNIMYQAKFGITEFSDLTAKEFKRQYTGLRGFSDGACSPSKLSGNLSAPDSYDWRDKGVVSPVKNQARCGSCWAFSVTGNVEGQYAIKYQNLLVLSEQQLVDCVTTCFGCGGGMMDGALKFLAKNGGVMLESDYPYKAAGRTCQFDASKAAVQLTGCNGYSGHSEDDLKSALVNVGPLSIGIDATNLNGYHGGIYDCTGPVHIDHGVLLVGYGNDGGKPFWIVKNSWGSKWGEQGYFRLARGNNACGVTNMVNSGVVQ